MMRTFGDLPESGPRQRHRGVGIVTKGIQPGEDQEAAFEQIIGEVDPAPESDALRQALGMTKYGTRDLPKREPADKP